jgi:excisionase family DNA binding protein
MTLEDIAGRLTVSVPEAGQLLGIGRDAAYGAVARGEIPVLRLGRAMRVSVPALLAMINGGGVT